VVSRLEIDQVRADISKISETISLMKNDALDATAVAAAVPQKVRALDPHGLAGT
jgi:hypothetical protein